MRVVIHGTIHDCAGKGQNYFELERFHSRELEKFNVGM
jgi:hypothetical protein